MRSAIATAANAILGAVAFLAGSAAPARALPILPYPTANDLAGPVFVQPFAGLQVVSESGGIGRTSAFFSDLPDGAFPGNRVVNLLGNFSAFDASGNPTPFSIVGVEVEDLGMTFTPEFGLFDFAGHASLTFQDSFDPDQVTFLASDFTLGFRFTSDAALDYSYVLLTSGLPIGSSLVFDDVETGTAPEPGGLLLLGSGALGAWLLHRKRTKQAR